MARTKLKLGTFHIGDAPNPGEGLRIGTVRRPPRGVPREQWRKHFDVWFPMVAPSHKLLRRFGAGANTQARWQAFLAAYERELTKPETRQAVALIAEVARRMPVSIGCYCPDESHCHRSRLRKVIERAAKT
jgi:uncharacterized protein YeaO (DUF488 family)